MRDRLPWNIHGPQRMNPSDFTILWLALVAPASQNVYLTIKATGQIWTSTNICPDIRGSQRTDPKDVGDSITFSITTGGFRFFNIFFLVQREMSQRLLDAEPRHLVETNVVTMVNMMPGQRQHYSIIACSTTSCWSTDSSYDGISHRLCPVRSSAASPTVCLSLLPFLV